MAFICVYVFYPVTVIPLINAAAICTFSHFIACHNTHESDEIEKQV